MDFKNIFKIRVLLINRYPIPKDFSGVVCDVYRTIFHIQNGLYHRENGPTIKHPRGTEIWYLNGRYHRLDGPAVKFHNEAKYWYIHGVNYSEKEFNKKILEMNEINESIL